MTVVTDEMVFAAQQTGDTANMMSHRELAAVFTAMLASRPVEDEVERVAEIMWAWDRIKVGFAVAPFPRERSDYREGAAKVLAALKGRE